MPFPTMPSAAADRAHEHARRYPERETLELATAGAAKVLGAAIKTPMILVLFQMTDHGQSFLYRRVYVHDG